MRGVSVIWTWRRGNNSNIIFSWGWKINLIYDLQGLFVAHKKLYQNLKFKSGSYKVTLYPILNVSVMFFLLYYKNIKTSDYFWHKNNVSPLSILLDEIFKKNKNIFNKQLHHERMIRMIHMSPKSQNMKTFPSFKLKFYNYGREM